MSPRRSSRARTTQPPTTAPQHTISSASSNSSSRAERSTRSHHRARSPPTTTTPPRSRSSEDVGESSRNLHSEPPQTRRRKREQEHDDIETRNLEDEAVEGDGEEEEITRCICGNQDYPGLPVALQELSARVDSKANVKDGVDDETMIHISDGLAEDAGGLFIQCDICKVWQHGGCVGILDEAMSPEEYFCEQCRHDLHKAIIGTNGQKSSRYLPVLDTISPKLSRSSSQAQDTDPKLLKQRRAPRANAAVSALSTKRRSTMNSRDAAYDEGEQLRRAIEESKSGGKTPPSADGSHGRVKRGRSESEEALGNSKRQRTSSASQSSSSQPNTHGTSQNLDFDEEGHVDKGSNVGGARTIRAAAARNQREKELRERESQKEKVRADAACRRKGRAERRRGDDSDPSEEPPLAWANSTKGGTKAPAQTLELPASSHHTPDTPPTGNSAPTSTSLRKTGRPPARRGRVGRNQYSKDREPPIDANGEHSLSPNRSQSYDRGYGDEKANGTNGTSTSEPGKLSKYRYVNPTRTSMNEMKRRVAAILEFISKTQIEMAGDPDPPVGDTGATSMIRGLAEGLGPMLTQSSSGEAVEKGIAEVRQKEFGQLSSLEMMDVLTRELVLWQKKFGKHGEK